jgi:hypothetical protein
MRCYYDSGRWRLQHSPGGNSVSSLVRLRRGARAVRGLAASRGRGGGTMAVRAVARLNPKGCEVRVAVQKHKM